MPALVPPPTSTLLPGSPLPTIVRMQDRISYVLHLDRLIRSTGFLPSSGRWRLVEIKMGCNLASIIDTVLASAVDDN